MSRVVLVSNRVVDLNNAVQAGGVAVALADVLRAQGGLWFGWSGEICEPGGRRATPTSPRTATPPSPRCR